MDVSGSGGAVDGVVCEDELSRRKRRDGKWTIKKVELEHTHLNSPGKAKIVKEYRMKNFTSEVRRKLFNYFEEGVPVSQIHGCMVNESGGLENITFTVKDLQHDVCKEQRLRMVGRLDNEGRLKDVLWVDARSRAAYEEFGDVVCFDATYLTYEYDLPFVNFVGVNHHGQSILLGCALFSREDCDTYC
ncbi:protein FAR-RED ELONGATED HYPOCOTYL 3-like [Chenopodium quinoa]|uniref:protein FAR-RED ELONGATED HYPOCOTYL 3-like n=1 Tax=Chenopodium quinoa TaxID=63459 RepID=UPI000B7834A1|nr:protein FAR-RED ELONGATED HYPOCOTYL 3-like [Chenopodium quinoa]